MPEKSWLTEEALQAYEGRYATMAGVVGVTKKTDYLLAEIMDNSLRLVPRADGQLGLQYRLLGLIPISLGEGDRIGISRATVAGREVVKASRDGQVMLAAERIHLVPIPEAWQKRVGDYEIANAGDDAVIVEGIRLRQDDGLLLVEYVLPIFSEKRMSIGIAPLSDSEALICGLGRGMGETIRSVTVGGEEMLQYSGYLLKKRQKYEN